MGKSIWVAVKSENGVIQGAEAHKTLHGCVLGILLDIDSRKVIDDEEGKSIANTLESTHEFVGENGISYKIIEATLRK